MVTSVKSIVEQDSFYFVSELVSEDIASIKSLTFFGHVETSDGLVISRCCTSKNLLQGT